MWKKRRPSISSWLPRSNISTGMMNWSYWVTGQQWWGRWEVGPEVEITFGHRSISVHFSRVTDHKYIWSVFVTDRFENFFFSRRKCKIHMAILCAVWTSLTTRPRNAFSWLVARLCPNPPMLCVSKLFHMLITIAVERQPWKGDTKHWRVWTAPRNTMWILQPSRSGSTSWIVSTRQWSWLDCNTEKQGAKSMVTRLKRKVCTKFDNLPCCFIDLYPGEAVPCVSEAFTSTLWIIYE